MNAAGKTFIRLFLIGFVLILGAAEWAHRKNLGLDDFYITYRYAQNLAEGHGLTYNAPLRFCGTSSPFLAALLGILGMLFSASWIPALSALIGVASLCGIAWYYYRWMSEEGKADGVLAAVLLLFLLPIVNTYIGSEFLPATLGVFASFYYAERRREGAAGLCLGLAMLFRADIGVSSLLLAAVYVWRHRRFPWKTAAVAFWVLLPWAIGLTFYFGTPLPGTLAAKQAQGASVFGFWHGGWNFLDSFYYFVSHTLSRSWAWLLGLFIAGLLYAMLNRLYFLFAFGLFSILYFVFYMVLNIPCYFWYTSPLHVGAALLAPLGVTAAAEHFKGKWRGVAACAAGLILFALPVMECWRATRPAAQGDVRETLYRQAGQWMDGALPPECLISHVEVGYLGYYSKREMFDPLGLVSPDASLDRVRRGQIGESMLDGGPDAIVLFPWTAPFSAQLWENPRFQRDYRLVQGFQYPGSKFCLYIYMKRTAAFRGGNIVVDLKEENLRQGTAFRSGTVMDAELCRCFIAQPPNSRWTYRLWIPGRCRLKTAVGIPPEAYQAPDHPGVSGRILLETEKGRVTLASGTLKPQGTYAFALMESDLSPSANQWATLTLENSSAPDSHVSNELLWEIPRIELEVPGSFSNAAAPLPPSPR